MRYFSKYKRWISVVTAIMLCLAFSLSSLALNESESNNTASTADVMYDDQNNYGYISSTSDVDWWYVSFPQGGWANYYLGNIPSGCNYDLYLYSANGTTLLESSTNTGNAYELIRYDVVANTVYRVKIVSKSGSSSSSSYMIRTKWYPTEIARYFAFNCEDVDSVVIADKCLPIMWQMGYDAGKYTNNSVAAAAPAFPSSKILVINNHGDNGYVRFSTPSGNTNLYAETNPLMGSNERALDTLNLSNVNLLVFASCNSGNTYYGVYGNLVDTALEQGAAAAIGWKSLIGVYTTETWLECFFVRLSQGDKIREAITEADERVRLNYSDEEYRKMKTWYYGTSDVTTQVLG